MPDTPGVRDLESVIWHLPGGTWLARDPEGPGGCGARIDMADMQPGYATMEAIRVAHGEASFVTCDVSEPAQVGAAVAVVVDSSVVSTCW